jgi:hypothetical protein
VVQRFRFVHAVPLNASNPDVRVHFIEYWEMGQDKGQHCSWVTDLRGRKRHVSHRRRGGRARWQIAHEPFNTLQNQGYHFAHNYGHGEPHLSVVCAIRRLLAFFVDQTQQLCCALCRAVWAKLGRKRLLWERRRALFYPYAVVSMRPWLEALLDGFKRSSPLVAMDSSSSLSMSAVTACHHTRALPSWGQWPLQDETRLPATCQRLTSTSKKSLQKTAITGPTPSPSCPLPWLHRVHKSSAGITV